MAPAGMPAELVRRIQSEIAAIVNLPEVRSALGGQGLYPVANTPAEFAAQIKSETAHWARIIREANIRAE